MEIQKVIETIHHLTNVTTKRGATEGEAWVAARKIGELLKIYNLSMDRVFLGETKCVTLKVETEGYSRRPIDSCVVAIAEYCDCRVWFDHQYNRATGKRLNSVYCFFGLPTDTEMAKYLYTIIREAIETETEDFKQTDTYLYPSRNTRRYRKTLTTNFQRAMAHRISARLTEMTQERQVEESVNIPGTGTSLVLVKLDKVKDEFEELNLHLKRCASAGSRYDHDAREAGREAGDRVNFNRPVNGGSNIAGFLQ